MSLQDSTSSFTNRIVSLTKVIPTLTGCFVRDGIHFLSLEIHIDSLEEAFMNPSNYIESLTRVIVRFTK